MEYIVEIIFWVIVGVVTALLGSSKHEEKKVDANKTVMRQQPNLRYSMYVCGVIIMGMLSYFGSAAIRDGALAYEPWILFFLILGILLGASFIFAGYIFYARHVFFDEEELLVGRPFRGLLHVKWQEISRVETKRGQIILYGADGRKLVKAYTTLENFDIFADMVKRMCSAKATSKQKTEWKNGARVMRRTAAAVVLLIPAVLMFALFALLMAASGYTFLRMFTSGETFGFGIMFVIGALLLLCSICLSAEKIRYTKEEITFSRLFLKKTFSWNRLQKVRRGQGRNNVQKLYLMWDGKEYAVSPAGYAKYYEEFEDFIIDIALSRNIPTQDL